MTQIDINALTITLEGAVSVAEGERDEILAEVERARHELAKDCTACADATGIASKHLISASRADVKAVSAIMTDILQLGVRKAAGLGQASGSDVIHDLLLGEILVELGFVSQDDVDDAIEHQVTHPSRIGDALLALGRAELVDIETAVHLQDHMQRVAASSDGSQAGVRSVRARILGRMLLGQLLVASGEVTQAQLEEALEIQRDEGLLLGTALVRIEATTTEAIEAALALQRSEQTDKPPA